MDYSLALAGQSVTKTTGKKWNQSAEDKYYEAFSFDYIERAKLQARRLWSGLRHVQNLGNGFARHSLIKHDA